MNLELFWSLGLKLDASKFRPILSLVWTGECVRIYFHASSVCKRNNF